MAKAKVTYVKKHKKLHFTSAKYKAMLKKCKKIAYLMNLRKCQSVTKLQTDCKGYGQCWKIARKNYQKNEDMIRVQEKKHENSMASAQTNSVLPKSNRRQTAKRQEI